MTTFTFTSPQGKTYTVRGPEGATEQQAFAILQGQLVPDAPETTAVDDIDFTGPDLAVNSMIGLLPDDEKLEGRTRQQVVKQRAKRRELENATGVIGEVARALQGGIDAAGNIARGTVVGSWLDEATAKLHGLIPGGETHDQALVRVRAQNRIQDEDHTGASTLGKLVGAFATGAPFVRGLQGASTSAQVTRGAATGAGYGAVYGAGEGENSDDRIEGAKQGATLGSLFGGGVPIALNVGARMAAPVAAHLAPVADRMKRSADDAAVAILGRKIAESGRTPRDLGLDIQKMARHDTRLDSNSYVGFVPGAGRQFGNNAETLADSTDGLQRLAGSVYRTGGPGAQRIRDTLDGRQIGPANRFAGRQEGEFFGQAALVEDAVERSMAIKGQKGAFATERTLIDAQRKQGRKLYEEAFKRAEPFSIVDELADVRTYAATQPVTVKRKLGRAASLFERNGKEIQTLQQFDDSKKALDDMISKAQRAGNGNLTRQLTEIKNGFLDKIHAPNANGEPTRNAAYQKARDAWGSRAEQREALDMGRNALKADSEMTVAQFRAMTPGQQTLFRIGFRRAVKQAQASKKPGSDVTQLFAQQRVQELMAEAIPRAKGKIATYDRLGNPLDKNGNPIPFANRPDRFGNLLEREGRKVATRNRVLGGSPTAGRQQDDVELAGDTLGELFGRFRQSPSLANMALEALTSGARKIFGFRQEVGEALARRLMETDPVERMKILLEIQRSTRPDQFGAFVAMLDDVAVRAGVSSGRAALALGEE